MKRALWPLFGAALGAAGIALFLSAAQFLPLVWSALTVALFWASVSITLREDIRIGAPCVRFTWLWFIPRLLTATIWVAAFLHQGTSRDGALRMMAAAVAAQSISRAGALAMAWVSRPAAGGLELCSQLSSAAAIVAILLGGLAALMYGPRLGAALILAIFVILRGAHAWFYRRHSGIDGDDVANARMLVEAFTVASLVWF